MKLGDIVIFIAEPQPSDPRLNKPTDPVEYPAIIYKIHEDPRCLGLYVFHADGLKRYGYVPFNENGIPKVNTWRRK